MRLRLDGTLDIECAQWSRPVVAAAYSPGLLGGAWVSHGRDPIGQLVDMLLAARGHWWTWSGGAYDHLALSDEFLRRGVPCQVNLSGSRASSIIVGDLRILDGYALVPMGLDRACDLAKIPRVGELAWPCSCGEGCGGYCAITEWLPLDMRAELADYCVTDCRAVWRVLRAVFAFAEEHDIELRATIGGTAWATAARWCALPRAEWHPATWKRIRRAYYGGRIVIGRAWCEEGEQYDIRSAYPAALIDTALPVGVHVEMGARNIGTAYERGVPCVVHATVRVPDSLTTPPLPDRTARDRVVYTHGRQVGIWTSIELASAESRGVTIEALHGGIAWPDGARRELRQYARTMTELRAAAGKGPDGEDTAWAAWCREANNAITGKLAESPDRRMVMMHPRQADIVICDGRSAFSLMAGCTVDECTGRCGAWEQIDEDGAIWGKPFYRQSASMHVHWAAWLTSATRVRLQDAIEEVGEQHVYSHTDSVWVRVARPAEGCEGPIGVPVPRDVGPDPGQWDHQGGFVDWTCPGPGRYRYTDKATGECIARASGVPRLTDRQWTEARVHDRAIVDERGVRPFLEAAHSGKGLFQARRALHRLGSEREDDGWRGDRKIGNPSGRTYPVSRDVIEQRDRDRSGRTGGPTSKQGQ